MRADAAAAFESAHVGRRWEGRAAATPGARRSRFSSHVSGGAVMVEVVVGVVMWCDLSLSLLARRRAVQERCVEGGGRAEGPSPACPSPISRTPAFAPHKEEKTREEGLPAGGLVPFDHVWPPRRRPPGPGHRRRPGRGAGQRVREEAGGREREREGGERALRGGDRCWCRRLLNARASLTTTNTHTHSHRHTELVVEFPADATTIGA